MWRSYIGKSFKSQVELPDQIGMGSEHLATGPLKRYPAVEFSCAPLTKRSPSELRKLPPGSRSREDVTYALLSLPLEALNEPTSRPAAGRTPAGAQMRHDRTVQTRLLFVRHGESVHTVEGFIGGPRACRGLTGRGHEQARAVARGLAAELGDGRPAAVYSSTLRRAAETATTIAAVFGVPVEQDCRLCTWHVPDYADGLTHAELREHAVTGGGVFRPFERDNETWAELVVRGSRAVLDIAERHAGSIVVVVGHSETVEMSFHGLGLLPLYRSFDVAVAPASVTEWRTGEPPTAWPPPRWTLARFNQIMG